jgi:hypothetical protein
MRDTKYATERATASIALDDVHECKIERIYVKENEQDEIRFSWWKNGKMMMRPLDLNEKDLIKLLKEAIKEDVFTSGFRSKVRSLFSK